MIHTYEDPINNTIPRQVVDEPWGKCEVCNSYIYIEKAECPLHSAAPALLAALQRLERWVRMPDDDADDDAYRADVEFVAQAIKQATGKES